MANDAPKLAGYTFSHPPKPSMVYWEPQYAQIKLSDGSLAVYNKGFILKATLTWGPDSWLEQDVYSALAVMYNQLTATALFYPRPDTYSTRVFNVHIVNDLTLYHT